MYIDRAAEELLSHDEVLEVVRKYKKTGEQKYVDIIVQNHVRLINDIILKQFSEVPVEQQKDLFQEGVKAVLECLESFKVERGRWFIAYAGVWIRCKLLRYVRSNRLIRLPTHVLSDLSSLRKIRKEFVKENNREPTEEELSDLTELSDARLKRAISNEEVEYLYLDSETDDGNTLESMTADENAEFEVEQNDRSKVLLSIIDSLSEEEKIIIQYRFNFDGGKPISLYKLGQKLGVTTEGARLKQNKLLNKLKRILTSKNISLESFV